MSVYVCAYDYYNFTFEINSCNVAILMYTFSDFLGYNLCKLSNKKIINKQFKTNCVIMKLLCAVCSIIRKT